MILILTPTYKAFDILQRLCDAVDTLTQNDYLHVLIDDDSGQLLPINPTKNRRILQIRRDIPEVIHKNGLGQSLQLGFDYANQIYCNEVENPIFEHVFVMESDVIPLEQGWDQKQIDLLKIVPPDWGTVDVQSVDEQGKVTYPCTVSPRHDEFQNPDFELLHYPDYQTTLVNQRVFNKGIKFGDTPSHFDVLFGRAMEQYGFKAYRAKSLKLLHVNGGGNSRAFLK